MKRISCFLQILIISVCVSCKDKDPGLQFAGNTGLDLYWHHTAGRDKGRYLLLSFMSAKAQRDKFEFKFEYRIKGREILIQLRETVSKGKCQIYPGPWGDECTSRGDVFIPESELTQGTYRFILQVDDRKVMSTLIVDPEKYTLQIPSNEFFNSKITTVYPTPENLIFGSIGYTGTENAKLATALIADFEKLGLTVAKVPDYPYRDLGGGSFKHLETKFWEPDHYMVSVLLQLNSSDVRTVFEMVRKYYESTGKKLQIGLFCSNNMEQLTGGPDSQLDAFYKL
ncbi:hypothetical protein FEM33_23695 [Dyadobacter flavalbus]|uniref:Uncharacterized protein n=1 Tax=Dyadobacter flavalbus TaxID=2579942 RepID=A0A5M8QD97_9BACT|nr:hypothetical protein [Dyadobacter flavalbus]KAA6432726.1 hypothetical protein FEM33_23695 [Dyadobacter flavalbus]